MSNKNYQLSDNFPKHIKNSTSTSDGLMSSEDKARLDSVFEFGLLSPATPEKDGIMTKEDKSKLDGIEDNANNYVHPNTPNIRHVTDTQINTWNNQIKYTNRKRMPITIGGLEQGTSFDNMDYRVLLNKLLYPYIEPTISGISITPNNTILEKGNNFTLNTIKFNINAPSLETSDAINYDFKSNNVSIRNKDIVSKSINEAFTILINSDTTLSVLLTDRVNNKTKTFNLISYRFIYPFYYGVTNSSSITDSLVKGLTKSVQSKGNKTIKYTTANQKMVFAYPKDYGKLSKIYDANNFNVLNTFSIQEISITGLDGEAVVYYVYINDSSTVSNYNMQFMF